MSRVATFSQCNEFIPSLARTASIEPHSHILSVARFAFKLIVVVFRFSTQSHCNFSVQFAAFVSAQLAIV